MFNRKKPADILLKKTVEAADLAQQADEAVDIVTRTVSSLELINQELEESTREIDAYIAELTHTREKMNHQIKNNTALIHNFSKLVATDTGE